MVDLTKRPDAEGKIRTRRGCWTSCRGRSGPAYAGWLRERGPAFTGGVVIATLDPFRGYGNAIRDELEDAVAVLDAFHGSIRLAAESLVDTALRATAPGESTKIQG